MGIFDSFSQRDKVPTKEQPGKGKQPNPPKQTGNKKTPNRPKSASTANQVPKRTHSKSFDLERELAMPHLVPSSPVSNVYNKTYDCVAFVVHCPIHAKIAVAKSPTNAIWLPYVAKASKSSWRAAAREGLNLVLANGSTSRYEWLRHKTPFDQMLLMDVCRIQQVSTHKFVARYTFYVRLQKLTSKVEASSKDPTKGAQQKQDGMFACCQDMGSLAWLALDFINEGCIENCWGPEVVDFSRKVHHAMTVIQETGKGEPSAKGNKSPPPPLVFRQSFHEFGVEQLYQVQLLANNRQGVRPSYLESLTKIQISHNDIERLYNDYLDHCYPSLSVTFDSFRCYMLKNNFETNELRLKRLFHAFNHNKNGYLSFNELLLGLIVMERDTPHVEFRIRFLFDYYDTKGRGVLLEEDFKKIVRDLNADRKGRSPVAESKLAQLAREAMGRFKTKSYNDRPAVTFTSFLNAIGSHAFRGTSVLCRSKKNVFFTISRRSAARTIKLNSTKEKLSQVITKKNYQGSCKSCKARHYKVVNQLSIIGADGYCSDKVEALKKPVGCEQNQSRFKSQSDGPTVNAADNFISEPLTSKRFNSAPFTLIDKIRHFNATKQRLPLGTFDQMQGLMNNSTEQATLLQYIKILAEELIPILANEPRCKQVSSPAFIIGDIHGNLEDLISLEKTIWKRFPETAGMHYLFLGDYVDRGRWSVECILYLLAMKLLKPQNITLLRGNHEVRDIQAKYTYRRECIAKYGESDGQLVWDLTNRIFDHMPLCAVVDGNVFCAHGGIPHAVHTVDEINEQIPNDVPNPEADSQAAWEIMWSDPMMPEPFRDLVQMNDPNDVANLRPGYIFNQKRGTAYYFNDVGINEFLADNQLSHIIRAHEVPKFGFMFHFDFKCTTIFSCSHYCGNDNECAVVLVDGRWMRVIRIDTTSNVAATDF